MRKKFALGLTLPCIALGAYAQTLVDLGSLTNDQFGYSTARSVSADGSVVVGDAEYYLPSGAISHHAFRWSDGVMHSLKDLTISEQGVSSAVTANSISADGKVIVGLAEYGTSGRYHAFRWTSAGMEDIGLDTANPPIESKANSVSADGNVVVGDAQTSQGNQAFRWTRATGMVILGTLAANNQGSSTARAASADGSVVIGNSAYGSGSNTHAFRWTSAGMVDLGDLTTNKDGNSYVQGLSADGSVVVGYAHYGSASRYHAFRWTSAGMVDLGDLTVNQDGRSYATALSKDGSVVVGYAQYDQAGRTHAFRWTSAGMVDLGDLTTSQQGSSSANAVSADGKVVVGEADYDIAGGGTSNHAFRWTSAGMQDLGDFTSTQDGRSVAYAVSADGSVVVGDATNDEGVKRAFIYKAPPDPGAPSNLPIQDYENLLKSFPKMAADKELAAAQQQLGMQRLLDQICVAGKHGINCFVATGTFETAGSDGHFGRRQQTHGIVTLGRGLDEQWTVGGSLSLTNSSLRHSAVNPKNSYGLSGWLSYSQTGRAGLGWQMHAAVGYAKQKTVITRGHGLANVHQVTGSSNLDTLGARLALGYGLQQPHGWLLTPELALTQQNSSFGAYRDSPSAFTAKYDKASLKTTVLNAGVNAQKAIGSQSQLRLSAGVEQDLHTDRMKLTGVSDIPGAIRFDLDSPLSRKKIRPYLSAGYLRQVSDEGAVFVDVGVMRGAFLSKTNISLTAGYSTRF